MGWHFSTVIWWWPSRGVCISGSLILASGYVDTTAIKATTFQIMTMGLNCGRRWRWSRDRSTVARVVARVVTWITVIRGMNHVAVASVEWTAAVGWRH